MRRSAQLQITDARSRPAATGAIARYSVHVVTAIVSVALYLLLFQALPVVGTITQFLCIALLAAAALTAYLTLKVPRRDVTRLEFGLLAITLMSGIASAVGSNPYSAGFTALFALAVLSLAVLARSLDTVTLLHAAARAFAAMALTVLVFYSAELRVALNDGSAARWSLRLKPLGLHPNLTGFIFGGAVGVLSFAALLSRGWVRLIYVATAALSFAIVLAASARGGLLASVAASAILGTLFAYRLRGRARQAAVGGVAVVGLTLAVLGERVLRYLYTVLELDSRTRGVDSGATGRTTVWLNALTQAFENRAQVFIGLGLRGATVEEIGSQTENSYITILLESGVIVGGLYILLVARSAFVGVVRARQASDPQLLGVLAVAWVVLYATVQSFFNRYLLAIGNPMSLVILVMLMHGALLERQGRRPRLPAVPVRAARPPLRRARRTDRAPDSALTPAE